MGHDKKKSAAPPPGPGPLPYLENLVHPCVRLPCIHISGAKRPCPGKGRCYPPAKGRAPGLQELLYFIFIRVISEVGIVNNGAVS
jgi:hypothetical protein